MSDISSTIQQWIDSSNSYDTEAYIKFFDKDAVIDEQSIGTTLKGTDDIKEYFETYFIGYKTHTTILELSVKDDTHAFIKIHFSGTFPQKELDGWFDLTFNDAGDKIVFAATDFES